MVQVTATPLPQMPGCFAKKGFKADIHEVTQVVEEAHRAGATDAHCEELAAWLESVIPFYLDKRKVKGVPGVKFMVTLRKRDLIVALKKRVEQVTFGVIKL